MQTLSKSVFHDIPSWKGPELAQAMIGSGIKVFGTSNEIFVTQILPVLLVAGKTYRTKSYAKILAPSAIGQILLTNNEGSVHLVLFSSLNIKIFS